MMQDGFLNQTHGFIRVAVIQKLENEEKEQTKLLLESSCFCSDYPTDVFYFASFAFASFSDMVDRL